MHISEIVFNKLFNFKYLTKFVKTNDKVTNHIVGISLCNFNFQLLRI